MTTDQLMRHDFKWRGVVRFKAEPGDVLDRAGLYEVEIELCDPLQGDGRAARLSVVGPDGVESRGWIMLPPSAYEPSPLEQARVALPKLIEFLQTR